jgi:HupE / UreJ protein
MKKGLTEVLLLSLLLHTASAFAHNLDEYLQAAVISLHPDEVHVSLRLVPGVAVLPELLESLDIDSDGKLSEAEQYAYTASVLKEISLRINGAPVALRVHSAYFPAIDTMKEGVAEIRLEVVGRLPSIAENRTLVFENHHLSRISVYLANILVPADKRLEIVSQRRNESQSLYEVQYRQQLEATAVNRVGSFATTTDGLRADFLSMFKLGMHHIAEGTDHLLFLLALLLPAALLPGAKRWTSAAPVRASLAQIVKIVTAFTLGHSMTLALAGFGLVRVSSQPVEVLIAVSILVSAAHAFRPIFPGREAVVAASFGLIHGLAFAGVLEQTGLGFGARLSGLLGFNLGIEMMQLLVVLATMPSLLLLSRTRRYSLARVCGAVFAGVASLGWIGERLFDWGNPVDAILESVAGAAPWAACLLLCVSLLCWRRAMNPHGPLLTE